MKHDVMQQSAVGSTFTRAGTGCMKIPCKNSNSAVAKSPKGFSALFKYHAHAIYLPLATEPPHEKAGTF